MRLRMLAGLIGTAILAASTPGSAHFSIDAISPDVPAVGEGDALLATPPPTPPPFVAFPAVGYGLIPGEELDAFSNGGDTICPAGNPSCFTIITYSVDRAAVGAAPSVSSQVSGNGAAGDIFVFQVTGTGVILTPPALLTDAPLSNLTIAPQSNLDALSSNKSHGIPMYFSIAPGAVAAAAARWAMPGLTAADILLGPGPVPTVYATAAALGLAPGDDIDGLALFDAPPLGVLTGADTVYISLAPGSPSLGTLVGTAGDIISVSPGIPAVVYAASLMDLAATDNLDALAMLDPPLPEPEASVPTLGAWGLGVLAATLGGVAVSRARKSASRSARSNRQI